VYSLPMMTQKRVLIAGVCAAAIGALAICLVLPEPSPLRLGSEWTMDIGDGTALAGAESDCMLSGSVVLTRHRRLARELADGVGPVCKYVLHLPDWPRGEDECVLEYPTATVRAVSVGTLGARLAEVYYRRRQGGIMYFTSERSDRIFLTMDSRWCRFGSVVKGLKAVP
jgi:hypothetical protein